MSLCLANRLPRVLLSFDALGNRKDQRTLRALSTAATQIEVFVHIRIERFIDFALSIDDDCKLLTCDSFENLTKSLIIAFGMQDLLKHFGKPRIIIVVRNNNAREHWA
jgi:hypothetical protein